MNTVFACILSILLLSVSASARQRVNELHPLLPYIFFDSGSAVIPDRYQMVESAEQARQFSEANLPSNSLDVYHHLLNIIGSRMRMYPKTKIEITGNNSKQPELGEVLSVSEARSRVVRDYLVNIWKIDPNRITLLPARDLPKFKSNIRDPLGIVENRRAEIVTEDWELIKPIITTDATPHLDLGISKLDIYNLILFKFDSPEPGEINDRIIREYILAGLRRGVSIQVAAHTDVVGLDDRCIRLSESRASSVIKLIKREAKAGMIASLDGLGTDEKLYSNDFPEGRFYNRSVQVKVFSGNNEQ